MCLVLLDWTAQGWGRKMSQLWGVLTLFLIYSDLLLSVCLTVVYWLKLSYALIPGLIYDLYFSA